MAISLLEPRDALARGSRPQGEPLIAAATETRRPYFFCYGGHVATASPMLANGGRRRSAARRLTHATTKKRLFSVNRHAHRRSLIMRTVVEISVPESESSQLVPVSQLLQLHK
jgi:hypothetical protein